MHLLSSGGSTVNTERTGASFGEANACSMRWIETRCFFKIVGCVVCCAFPLGNGLRRLLTVCGTLGMKKQKQDAQATGTELCQNDLSQNGNFEFQNVTDGSPRDIVSVLSRLTHHVKCLSMCGFFIRKVQF